MTEKKAQQELDTFKKLKTVSAILSYDEEGVCIEIGYQSNRKLSAKVFENLEHFILYFACNEVDLPNGKNLLLFQFDQGELSVELDQIPELVG